MPSALVLGSGWAGMAAAFDLRQAGLDVLVLEKAAGPGGLGRSFEDPKGKDELDNGQHLMLESYTEMFRLLRQAGLPCPVKILPSLSLTLLGPRGRKTSLACPALPSFMALPWGILGLKDLSLPEKARFLIGPLLGGRPPLGDETVEALLDRWRQPENLRRLFWRPLALGTLNTESCEASARLFVQVLWQGFLRHPMKSRFALASAGLSKVFPDPLRIFLERQGVHFSFRDPVQSVRIHQGRVSSLRSRSGDKTADLIVSALPWEETAALAPGLPGKNLEPSPLVTAYLWFDRPVMDSPMVGLMDLPFDWAFDRGILLGQKAGSGPLALVKSAAGDLSKKSPPDIGALATKTISQAFPLSKAKLLRFSVYKEVRATFKASPGIDRSRPGPKTRYENLFLAGSWTATNLPATLEGAVRSGRRAARAALESLA